MSVIKPALWASEITEPMPEGMTYAMFNRLATQKDLQQDLNDCVELITKLEKLKPNPELNDWIHREQIQLSEIYRRLGK